MRVWTVHVREGQRLREGQAGTGALVLVPERFAWEAALFGPLWLFAHRAWIAGVIALAAYVAAGLLPTRGLGWTVGLALAWALGLWGHDLRRWSLARRGFAFEHVVTGRDEDGALVRLLDAAPGLTAGARP